jgi:GTP 3',8-cyclase
LSPKAVSLATSSLSDSKGRVARKLRISVTDRCNFACLFCMPQKEKIRWLPQADILSFDEIERVAMVLASMGIEAVRVTGGEPLLRKGVDSLVARLNAISGIDTVDMTTNGWFLEDRALALKDAGLRGVTVSLHSLKADRFAKVSGVDALPKVLRGIDAAIAAGLDPVKINSVAIRGYNDDEILDLVDFAHARDISIRFIEFMPLDGLGIWSPDAMITGKEIRERVEAKYGLASEGRKKGSTASTWKLGTGGANLGLITPMTEPFCDDCDRIRLTSDGKLLSCLFDTEYHDLKPFLRGERTDMEMAEFITAAVKRKPDGVGYMPGIDDSWAKPRNMNAIGG